MSFFSDQALPSSLPNSLLNFLLNFLSVFLLSFVVVSVAFARQASEADYVDKPFAEVAILDKITARVERRILPVGQLMRGVSEDESESRLLLQIERCADTPPEFIPEAVAFVHLTEALEDDPEVLPLPIFQGWMFASSPGLSAVEHPVYDVWLLGCRAKSS